MTWPAPEPGLVLHYSYLWAREAGRKRKEGAKDRPCAVVLLVRDSVFVLPITSSPPTDPTTALEVPPHVKRRLGLDADRCWVVVAESNEFVWPGPDLRFAPGKGPETAVYGMLPANMVRHLRDLVLARLKAGRFTRVPRTE